MKKSDKMMQITNYSGIIKTVPCYEYSWINTKGEVVGTLSKPFCNMGAYFDRGSEYSPSYHVSDFTESGYAIVSDQTTYNENSMLITADGKEIGVDKSLSLSYVFNDGNVLCVQYRDDGKINNVILGNDGKVIYETEDNLSPFDDRHIEVQTGSYESGYRYGLADTSGKPYFEPQFKITYGTFIDGILMYGRMGNAVYAVKDDHTTVLLSDELYNDVGPDGSYYNYEYEKIRILSSGYTYLKTEKENDRPDVTLFYKGKEVFKGDFYNISHDGYIVDNSLQIYDRDGAFRLPDGYRPEHIYTAFMAFD